MVESIFLAILVAYDRWRLSRYKVGNLFLQFVHGSEILATDNHFKN